MKWTSVIALSYLIFHIGMGYWQMVSSQSFNNVIQTEQADSENDCLENDTEDMDQADETQILAVNTSLFLLFESDHYISESNIISRIELPETPPPIAMV